MSRRMLLVLGVALMGLCGLLAVSGSLFGPREGNRGSRSEGFVDSAHVPRRLDEALGVQGIDKDVESVLRVVDASTGTTLTRSRVQLLHHDTGLQPALTSKEGVHRIRVQRAGFAVLQVLCEGYAAERRTVAIVSGASDIALRPLAALRVTVRDSRSGQPMAGARVTVRAVGAPRTVWQGETDDRGMAVVPSQCMDQETELRITAWAAGFHRSRVEVSPSVGSVHISLQRGLVLRVRVLDEAGRGIVGAEVFAPLFPGRFRWAEPARTQRDGRCTVSLSSLRHAAWGLILHVRADDYQPRYQTVLSGTEKEVVVRLGPMVRAGVTVRDATGRGVPGARVRFIPKPRTADGVPGDSDLAEVVRAAEDGRAELTGVVGDATYVVQVLGDSNLPPVVGWYRSDELASFPVLALPPARKCRVDVQNRDGQGLGGCALFVRPEEDGKSGWLKEVLETTANPVATTGGDGVATLSLPETQAATVIAVAVGYAPAAVLAEPSTTVVQVILDAGVPIVVRVRDQRGAPVSGATVSIAGPPRPVSGPREHFSFSFSQELTQRTTTDARGEARVVCLSAGQFLQVSVGSSMARPKKIRARDLDQRLVDVIFYRRTRQSVFIVGPDGLAIEGAVVKPHVTGLNVDTAVAPTGRSGETELLLPLRGGAVQADSRVTLSFYGAARGRWSARLDELKPGARVVAQRARWKRLRVHVKSTRSLKAGMPVPYSILPRGAPVPSTGGIVVVGRTMLVQVPECDLVLVLGGSDLLPSVYDLPSEGTAEIEPVTYQRVELVNRTEQTIELMLFGPRVPAGLAWKSPSLLPGESASVRLVEGVSYSLDMILGPWRRGQLERIVGGQTRRVAIYAASLKKS